MVKTLKNILGQYSVDRDFYGEVRDGYRDPIEYDLNGIFDERPNYRYGGSLAKNTAIKTSSDIDLLCYFDAEYAKPLKVIYEETASALEKKHYIINRKNSAIVVLGTTAEGMWDISVDVVPGRYTSNEDNKDVYLWCNKTNNRLKSNPEIQIEKIRQSKMRDVIKLIKIFRGKKNFAFKSFFLEIFAVDVVEPLIKDEDNLYDKLIAFCSCYKDIGVKKIYDPANPNNDIMTIHEEYEFRIIRNNIKNLYDVLLTNNEAAVVDYILGKEVDVRELYKMGAKEHSSALKFDKLYGTVLLTTNKESINNGRVIGKDEEIVFNVEVPYSLKIKKVQLVVSNSGYESAKNNDLRGEMFNVEKKSGKYEHKEHTSYNGDHYVQAIVQAQSGHVFYSAPIAVRVRDYE